MAAAVLVQPASKGPATPTATPFLTPHCATPDRDSIQGLESWPESHRGCGAVASDSVVRAGRIAPPRQVQPDRIAPRVVPGATPRRPRSSGPIGVPPSHLPGRGRSGPILPSGRGRDPPPSSAPVGDGCAGVAVISNAPDSLRGRCRRPGSQDRIGFRLRASGVLRVRASSCAADSATEGR